MGILRPTPAIITPMRRQQLSQTKAAKRIGMAQPRLSAIVRGHFNGYSVERMLRILNRPGHAVKI
jgi:predicted XRE-type DNA-binding protein